MTLVGCTDAPNLYQSERFRRTVRGAACALVFLCAASGSILAQQTTFTASVSGSTVGVGEQFQVTFTLSGGNLKQYKDFHAPDLNANFLTLMGPSTSTSMQIINGSVSSSISWTYVLQPRAQGKYTIPPASVVYDGQTMRSNSMTVTVGAGSPGQAQQGHKKNEENSPNVDLGDNLFLKAIVDRHSAYVGEPISVTYKLYSRVAFRLDNPVKLPRTVGFWAEDLEAPQQLKPTMETYNGKQYQTFVLRKVVYFPTQSGELTIEPFDVDCTVQVRQKRRSGDDFFDKFFSDPFFDSYQNVKKSIASDAVRIQAKPLPEAGKPASFKGAVGSFNMRATTDRTAMNSNETATLTLAIRGEGNIKLLDAPEIQFPAGLDHYDPKITEDLVKTGGRIGGSKTFEFLLVPRYAGSMSIPPIEFSYFDPETHSYRTLRSDEFRFEVREGLATPGGVQRSPTVATDIRPLRIVEGGSGSGREGPTEGWMLFAYLFPLAAASAGVAAKRRYDRIHGDVAGMNVRRANRRAERHLAHAKRYLEAGAAESYYLEIAHALWGYTQHKLSIATSEVSLESVDAALASRGLPPETIARFHASLERTEFARFSPTRATESEMRDLYAVARAAIVAVEQALAPR